MAMRDILFPECVITHMKAKSKEDALHQLYEVLLKNGKVKTSFYDAVLERERDYPTGLELEEYLSLIHIYLSTGTLSEGRSQVLVLVVIEGNIVPKSG